MILMKKLYNASTLLQRCLLAAGICVFFSGTQVSAQSDTADETMPSSIPEEVIADWKDQGGTAEEIKASLPQEYQSKCDGSFENACHWRRVVRMIKYTSDMKTVMFCRHHDFGGTLIGYHDNVDNATSDNSWKSNSALCLMNFTDYYPGYKEILSKSDAVIRDPCISFDGRKVLFAMSGQSKGTGYRLFEMEIGNPETIKQLTENPEGMVVADFEPCYLPNGDIMFSSTRNFGMVACGWNPTTNMFVMEQWGHCIRQIGFDQGSTFYPVLMEDGTVLYSRWEHNDRDVTGSMGLFVMNPDGSHQIEYFGNQTSWPLTFIHARQIPGSRKIMCVAGGVLMAPYAGELVIIDPAMGQDGMNGTECVEMVAPIRDTKPQVRTDMLATGDVQFLFQNPYPLSDSVFLVSWRKTEDDTFRLYFMDVDGNRELLAWADQSVSQPVVVKSLEKVPPRITEQANYRRTEGIYTIQDVYYGEGMKGIKKENGTAKTLRVVKLHSRIQGTGQLGGMCLGTGPAGAHTPAMIAPVSLYGASWDVKEVLGETKIYEDGSASFRVPARTPVYFQVLDSMGYCIATMRSWSTLMPGETFSCMGCHENRNLAPPGCGAPLAASPDHAPELDTPLGIENRPFDYREMVQPIFNANCVGCHRTGHVSGIDLSDTMVSVTNTTKEWTQSYVSLLENISVKGSNRAISISTIFSPAEQQPPRSFGSFQSGIMKAVNGGVEAMKEVKLSDTDKKIIACWVDLSAPHYADYKDGLADADVIKYERCEVKRERWRDIEAQCFPSEVYRNTNGEEDRVRCPYNDKKSVMVYLPADNALVLRRAFQGLLYLMDLRGRVIVRKQLPEMRGGSTMAVALPGRLGTGLYLVRVEDEKRSVATAKIAVVR